MLLKTFSTAAHHYIYSAWHNGIARVPKHIFDVFLNGSSGGFTLRKTALELGLLSPDPLSVNVWSESRIGENIDNLLRNGPEVLVLGVTEQCNFRCRYCTYSGAYNDARTHSSSRMSPKVARSTLEWYFSFKRNHYHIGFYGGEPLLQFRLIHNIILQAKELRPSGAVLSFGITTNGALLNREIIEFLKDNEVELHISIDGPRDVHDRYRVDTRARGTFTRVWNAVRFIKAHHPAYFEKSVGFTMTVAPPDPLPRIQEFINDHEEIFQAKIPKVSTLSNDPSDVYERLGVATGDHRVNFAGIESSFIEDCVHGTPPSGLARGYCEASYARIHRREMVRMDNFDINGGQCMPGARCLVDTSGKFHMCERINDHFPIGSVRLGFDFDSISKHLVSFGRRMEKACGDCWALRLCRKCIPDFASGGQLSEERLVSFCEQKRTGLEKNLINYCSARERKEDCFEKLNGDQSVWDY